MTVIVLSFFESVLEDHSKDHPMTVTHTGATRSPGTRTPLCRTQLIAALGGLAGIVSETIALALGSSPQSLHGGIVVLASQYAKTTDGSRRAALASAADALIAATNAVTWAGILTASAILLLSLLLRPAGMGAKLGTLGVITGALGIASEALRPTSGPGYILYGMLLPLWFALIGRKLLQRNA